MKKMGRYLKAYPIERLREYPGWSAAAEAADRPYVYLQENYTVTQGIFLDEEVVFDRVTDEWTAFCHDTLGFQVPPTDSTPSPREGEQ